VVKSHTRELALRSRGMALWVEHLAACTARHDDKYRKLAKSHLRELALHVRNVTLIFVEGADHFLEYAEGRVDADCLTLGLSRHLKIDVSRQN